MNGINYLTHFLNPRKNSPTADRRKSHLFTRIDQAYINAGYIITSDDVTSFVVNEFTLDFYRVYDSLPSLPSNIRLYAQFSPNSINYYFQKEIDGVFKYATLQNILKRNEDDHFFKDIDDTFFTHIGFYDQLFYNTEEKILYTVSETIPEVTITARRFLSYSPNKLGGLTNGAYSLQYKDASGYNDGIVSKILNKHTGDIFASSSEQREVTLELSTKKGQLYWYPRVQIGTNKRIILYYDYNPRGNENSSVNGEDFAIKLEFHHPESFFAFITLTYFANGISPLETSEGSGTRKADLFTNYAKIFEILMKQNNDNLTQKLAYLFYVHEDFFLKNQYLVSKLKGPDNILGIKFIWDTISSVLESGPSNTGIDSETILLKLLNILKIIQKDNKKTNTERNDYILSELLYRETSNQESYLKAMYNNFDGDRFVLYNQFIYQLWVNSSYVDPRNPAYMDTSQLIGKNDIGHDKPQLMLPYKTNKLLGFYTSNMDIDFDEKENIVVKPDDSSIDNIAGFFDPELGIALDNLIEEDWINVYHPLQPVYLMNPNKDKAFSLHKISPMILLKANEDEGFWSNVATATDYAFDIITTASGVGNLAKFRHLGRIIKAAKASNNSRKVIIGYQISRVVRGTAAFAEITSGTVNALLKITGINDTDFGKSLSEFLFWLELAALTGEITNSIKKGIQRNAKTLTGEKIDVLDQHLDDLVKKGEIDEVSKRKIKSELNALSLNQRNLFDDKLKISSFIADFAQLSPKKLDDAPLSMLKAEKSILQKASLIEDSAKQYEYGYIWNTTKGKFKTPKPYTSFANGHIEIGDAFGKGNKLTKEQRESLKGCIFTHNHPNFTRLSNDDIFVFLKLEFNEIRAINLDGVTYSLKLKPGKRVTNKEYNALSKSIELLQTQFYEKNQDRILNFILDNHGYFEKQKFDEQIANELDDLIEELVLTTLKDKLEYRIFK